MFEVPNPHCSMRPALGIPLISSALQNFSQKYTFEKVTFCKGIHLKRLSFAKVTNCEGRSLFGILLLRIFVGKGRVKYGDNNCSREL